MFHKTSPMLIFACLIAAILTDSLTFGQVNVEPNTALLNDGDRTDLLCRYGRSINYCRIEIPGEKVLNLSPDWNKTPGFTYYGEGLAAGQCGVTIERVKGINNGQVKCSLGVEGEEMSGTIDLVVAIRPQQPIIELLTKPERDGYFPEGSQFFARCIVREGRPAANISWYIDDYPADKRVGQLDVSASATNEPNVTLATTVQEIQWHLSADDNGRKLICRSHHQTDRETIPPQEAAIMLLVKYSPIRQTEALVYGLYLDRTAMVNMTIRSNPAPQVEWTVEGVVIRQGEQSGRFSVYEPQYLGQDYYNVTMAIAGLTLEDTTKTYQMRASNALGSTDYQVRISSSSTPPTAGLDIGAIIGIVVAIAVLVLIVMLVLFARATGRWCFGGKSVKTATSETSDTESADVRATSTATIATTANATETASAATAAAAAVIVAGDGTETDSAAVEAPEEIVVPKKSKRLPSLSAFFKRINERDGAKYKVDNGTQQAAADALEGIANPQDSAANEATDGNDNQAKEDKQLVYAELVLKPSENNEATAAVAAVVPPTIPPKNSTEYAEIAYGQKPHSDQQQQQASSK